MVMFSKKKHWPKTRLFLPETVVGHGHLQNDMLMNHDHGKGNDFEPISVLAKAQSYSP